MQTTTTARTATAAETDAIQYMTFYVKDVYCALPTVTVQEVIRPGRITPVPGGPGHVVGILNLRGKIVTILDLARRLELGPTATGEATRALILERMGEFVGLLVDAVADVQEIRPDTVAPPPANLRGTQGRYFEGVHESENRLLAMLSVEEVLSEEER